MEGINNCVEHLDLDVIVSFSGALLGSAITAVVSFIILYRTLRSNRKENESNRVLQLKVLEYQIGKYWLSDLKGAILLLYEAMDINEYYTLAQMVGDSVSEQDFTNQMKRLCIRMNKAISALNICLVGHDDQEAKEFKAIYNSFKLDYHYAIMDIKWFRSFCESLKLDYTSEWIKERVEQYKTQRSNDEPGPNNGDRIWEDIKRRGYQIGLFKYEICKDTIDKLDDIILPKACESFIQHETDALNKKLSANG